MVSKDEKAINDLDALLRQALKESSESDKHLEAVLESLETGEEINDDLSFRLLQLVLQYRLDKEDVIQKLLRLNNRLCHAIGINEQNSNKQSLDIAAHMIGKDNLLKELAALGGLWRELNKALALTEKSKRLQQEEKRRRARILSKLKQKYGLTKESGFVEKEHKISAKERALYYSMKDAVGHQEYFRLNIEQLTEAYHQYEGIPKFGHIYDYLAGLKGPISQFHQAVMHGLAKSDAIFQQLTKRLKMTNEKILLNNVLLRLNKAIQDNLVTQKNLLRTQQNEKQYWLDLEANLQEQQKKTPKPSKRFDDAMTLRRTMNIFSR